MLFENFEDRPWGRYYVIHDETNYKLKRIEVYPKGCLSYQYHHKRSETWTIVQGKGIVTLNGVKSEYTVGMTITIPQGAKHRIENPNDERLVFIEVQTGSYFGEDDIVRIEDVYNRK
jgi:mannose-6-phosphate isomerase